MDIFVRQIQESYSWAACSLIFRWFAPFSSPRLTYLTGPRVFLSFVKPIRANFTFSEKWGMQGMYIECKWHGGRHTAARHTGHGTRLASDSSKLWIKHVKLSLFQSSIQNRKKKLRLCMLSLHIKMYLLSGLVICCDLVYLFRAMLCVILKQRRT